MCKITKLGKKQEISTRELTVNLQNKSEKSCLLRLSFTATQTHHLSKDPKRGEREREKEKERKRRERKEEKMAARSTETANLLLFFSFFFLSSFLVSSLTVEDELKKGRKKNSTQLRASELSAHVRHRFHTRVRAMSTLILWGTMY